MKEIEILCAHANSPDQTAASLRFLARYIQPLKMDYRDGYWACSCGYKVKGKPASD